MLSDLSVTSQTAPKQKLDQQIDKRHRRRSGGTDAAWFDTYLPTKTEDVKNFFKFREPGGDH